MEDLADLKRDEVCPLSNTMEYLIAKYLVMFGFSISTCKALDFASVPISVKSRPKYRFSNVKNKTFFTLSFQPVLFWLSNKNHMLLF